jgi:hypothetical protein
VLALLEPARALAAADLPRTLAEHLAALRAAHRARRVCGAFPAALLAG